MKTLFVVNQIRGAAWDASKPIRSQALWDEHAAFMDQLTAGGFIVLGGPLGDPEGEAMLVVAAPDEETVKTTLAKDPWRDSGHLTAPKIQRWTIFLEAAKEGDSVVPL
jgi:uncharacterized protein YciI